MKYRLSFYMAEWCNSNTTFQEIVENGAIPFPADRKGGLYLQFYGDSLNRTSDRTKQVRQFAISEDGQSVANDALRRIGLEE